MSRCLYELVISGYSSRVARVAEDVNFAAKIIGIWRVGPIGLPKTTRTWKINKSPVRHSKFKETWVLQTWKHLIHVEGDVALINRFLNYVAATLDPVATIKVTQNHYHKLGNLYSFFPVHNRKRIPSLLPRKVIDAKETEWWFTQGKK